MNESTPPTDYQRELIAAVGSLDQDGAPLEELNLDYQRRLQEFTDLGQSARRHEQARMEGVREKWKSGWISDRTKGLNELESLRVEADSRGRNAWPGLLFDRWVAGRLTVADLRCALGEAWDAPEWPERVLGRRTWVELFRTAGFVSTEGRIPPPTTSLTVYRGSVPSRRRGMAWTLDHSVAVWFAERCACFGRQAALYQMQIEPQSVLAMFDARKEAEVVVDIDAIEADHIRRLQKFQPR